jgi:hypothetical protein
VCDEKYAHNEHSEKHDIAMSECVKGVPFTAFVIAGHLHTHDF